MRDLAGLRERAHQKHTTHKSNRIKKMYLCDQQENWRTYIVHFFLYTSSDLLCVVLFMMQHVVLRNFSAHQTPAKPINVDRHCRPHGSRILGLCGKRALFSSEASHTTLTHFVTSGGLVAFTADLKSHADPFIAVFTMSYTLTSEPKAFENLFLKEV